MYKLSPLNPFNNQQTSVIRLLDGACVPLFAPENTDYQAYLKWLEEGNAPEAAE